MRTVWVVVESGRDVFVAASFHDAEREVRRLAEHDAYQSDGYTPPVVRRIMSRQQRRRWWHRGHGVP